MYAKEDDYSRIDYPLMAAATIIAFYEEYFQIRYPLPKLGKFICKYLIMEFMELQKTLFNSDCLIRLRRNHSFYCNSIIVGSSIRSKN